MSANIRIDSGKAVILEFQSSRARLQGLPLSEPPLSRKHLFVGLFGILAMAKRQDPQVATKAFVGLKQMSANNLEATFVRQGWAEQVKSASRLTWLHCTCSIANRNVKQAGKNHFVGVLACHNGPLAQAGQSLL